LCVLFICTATSVFCSALPVAFGQDSPKDSGEDWPHWRGPNRNDHSIERLASLNGIPSSPTWTKQLGEGSSSPVVARGKVYGFGWKDGQERVYCVDAKSGAVLWTTAYDAPRFGRRATGDQGLYSGPSSTPEYDVASGWLYTLGTDGDLRAWDATGTQPKPVWAVQLYEQYDVPRRPKVGRSGLRDYGYTSSPLLVDDTLVVEVGAREGTLIGFDKKTGKELWRSQSNDPGGHNGGPVPIQVEGIPCVAVHHFNGLLVTRVDKGRAGTTIAQYPWLTDFGNNIATPAVQGNSIVITSSYNQHKITRLDISLKGATKIWEQEEASKVCSPIIHKGSVYWAWRQMACLDFETGKLRWKGGRFGDPGSCIVTADDRLVVWSDKGDLTLVDTAVHSPAAYRELAKRGRIGKDDAWPHVVLSHGQLFCKDRSGYLACFDMDPNAVVADRKPVKKSLGIPSPSGKSAVSNSPAVTSPSEPFDPRGDLLFGWDAKTNRVLGVASVPLDVKPAVRSKVKMAGGAAEFGGGSVVVAGADKWLHLAAAKSPEITLEAKLETASLDQRGPARIISQSIDAYHRNFTLGQEESWLVLRLRTSKTDDNGRHKEAKLFRLEVGKKYHVVVSYSSGNLVTYVDGVAVSKITNIQGDLRNWESYPFLFGDEWDGGRTWKGNIDRVVLYRRFVGPEDAAKLYRTSRASR
jgi:outer membrane protein assembly factor BamB